MALKHPHDLSYKLLFSHQRMVADLLKEYAPREWVRHLDLSALERVHSVFVSDELSLRRSDVVWRARWKESGDPVYFILEFQSEVNRFMSLRSAVYAGMLCQDLVRARQLPSRGKLPRVAVLVLYNGKRPWTAPLRLEELFESAPADMKECSWRFGYVLVEERAFSLEELRGCKNAAAIVFRLEKSRTPEQIRQVVVDVLEWFAGEEHQSLRHSLATWILDVLLPCRFPGVAFPMIGDLTEVKCMLYENIREWKRNLEDAARMSGLEAGIEKGIEQGIMQGEAQLLASMLAQKFGALPARHREEIEAADSATLLRWAGRALNAGSIDQVFDRNGQ